MDGRTDSPCVLQDFVPFGAAALLPLNLNHFLLKQGTGTADHLLPLGCYFLLSFPPSFIPSFLPSFLPLDATLFWAAASKGTKSCRTQGESVRLSVRTYVRTVPPPHSQGFVYFRAYFDPISAK